MRFLLLSALMLLVSYALTSSAQEGPESPCITGAKWHLTQATHWWASEGGDSQAFHAAAADSLLRLNDLGDGCQDWQLDAGPHTMDATQDDANGPQGASNHQSQAGTE